MEWTHVPAAFFSGMFLANFVPHFVHGVSGDRFPTPFAKPPGQGLSSPTVNVVWSLANLVVGFALFRASHVTGEDIGSLLPFLLGITLISLFASKRFATKHKE